MIRVNLLPYREEAKKARRNEFFALCGFVLLVAAVLVFLGYSILEGYISNQEGKNAFLKKEIAELDKQIDQIKGLQEQTQALLSRKQIIESLQNDRGESVYLLSEMVKQVPEGVYLRSIKQVDKRVELSGMAQSNARVSTLMRNLENSPWLERPQLIEIKAVSADRRRLSQFSMVVYLSKKAAASPSATEAKK